jgi:hypothetical protein
MNKLGLFLRVFQKGVNLTGKKAVQHPGQEEHNQTEYAQGDAGAQGPNLN